MTKARTAKPPRPAVGYVSSVAASRPRTAPSLEARRAALRQRCRERKLRLVATLVEETPDLARGQRPALREAIGRACRDKGVLVAASLACVAGSTLACIRVAQRLEEAGADLICLDDAIDTTARGGRAFFRLMRSLAGLPMERLKLARQAPYGFDLADDGEHLIVSTAQQAVIRRIIDASRAGQAHARIAETLNRDGVPGAGGQPWDAAAVRLVIAEAPTSRWTFDDE